MKGCHQLFLVSIMIIMGLVIWTPSVTALRNSQEGSCFGISSSKKRYISPVSGIIPWKIQQTQRNNHPTAADSHRHILPPLFDVDGSTAETKNHQIRKVHSESRRHVFAHLGSSPLVMVPLGLTFPAAAAATTKDNKGSTLTSYSQFRTLDAAFGGTTIVGLYFAASWCPMSTVPTFYLEKYFGELLTTNKNGPPSSRHGHAVPIPPLSIVYVSSDDSGQSWKKYQQQKGWISVPYRDTKQRSALKKEFSICGQREMESLSITERRGELPTLILFNGETREIITTKGVQDLYTYGPDALDHWMTLL